MNSVSAELTSRLINLPLNNHTTIPTTHHHHHTVYEGLFFVPWDISVLITFHRHASYVISLRFDGPRFRDSFATDLVLCMYPMPGWVCWQLALLVNVF
jgi:hypothetical protein